MIQILILYQWKTNFISKISLRANENGGKVSKCGRENNIVLPSWRIRSDKEWQHLLRKERGVNVFLKRRGLHSVGILL